tara:strand:+ start:16194 stop:17918 length:1725 start_codon:yes stop_codon:yes gene_type:complete
MCGLAGFISSSNKLDKYRDHIKENFKYSLKERGPDNTSFFENNHLILCHTRLGIQGMFDNEANQPFITKNNILIFNGEIFNHFELRKQYLEEVKFKTTSDTETLAYLLEKYSFKKVLSILNGIFAFSLYKKNENKVLIARDHMGIKPLYYFFGKIGQEYFLTFSSYASSIVRSLLPFKNFKLSRQGLINFFMLGAPFGKYTLFQNIFSLEPRSFYEFDINKWSAKSSTYDIKTNEISPNLETIASIENIADCKTGILLSGGVDSSSLATILKPNVSFHLSSQEIIYAQHVADKISSDFKVIKQKNINFSNIYYKYAEKTGHCSASCPIPYITAESIKSHNIRVIYSANGADELFYGYPRTPIGKNLKSNNSYFWGFNKKDHDFIHNDHNKQVSHIFRNFNTLKPIILGKRITLKPPSYKSLNIKKKQNGWHFREYELLTYDAWDLNVTLDHSFMMFGIEARVPFLNSIMLNYAKGLDWEDNISSEYGRKKILKDLLMKEGISNKVWDRDKVGFSLNNHMMLKRRLKTKKIQQELKDICDFKLDFTSRDGIYIESALHAFFYWKKAWIDTGIVKI